MIPVGFSELGKAFRMHDRVAVNANDASHYLLLFYAVECGLKSVYLRRNKLMEKNIINEMLLSRGHDLQAWVKELRLSAQLVGATSSFSFHLKKDGKDQPQPIKQAHQAWRYGALIDRKDEKMLINWLWKISDWIQKEGIVS